MTCKTVLTLSAGLFFQLASGCTSYYNCSGLDICSEGSCVAPPECTAGSIFFSSNVIRIKAQCRATMDTIRLAHPIAVTKEGTEYTLHKPIVLTHGAILEIHGEATASSPDAVVTLLKLKSDTERTAPITSKQGKISIQHTSITSYDESIGGPDERLQDRAYIAALSWETSSGKSRISRMDVEDSDISYLGNEGDYHTDIENNFGLVWKVEGYDDRYPGENYDIFSRIGVYGTLTRNKIHDMYMGPYCYGMKGDMVWSYNEIYDNMLNGINPQDNSDGMTIHNNHVHDNGWHGIEVSKRCERALVYDNVVEDNTRVGIFFHRSTDYAEAYGNTCKRNLEGDIGIFESTGVKIHDNVSEGGKIGIRISMGVQEAEVYDNTISDTIRYGVFFYRGSNEPEVSADWGGRPRFNTIRNNTISSPGEGKGVGVKDSDGNFIIDNTFIDIDSLRFDGSTETLVTGNVLPSGTSFSFANDATLADGSQSP